MEEINKAYKQALRWREILRELPRHQTAAKEFATLMESAWWARYERLEDEL